MIHDYDDGSWWLCSWSLMIDGGDDQEEEDEEGVRNGMVILNGQGVGCARAFWGRKYTRMVLGQGRKYTQMVLARVARVTASSVHAVRGLICTRGQGPRLYTRNGFADFCCMYTFVLTAVYFVCSMCAGCQVPNNALWTCVKNVPKQSIP